MTTWEVTAVRYATLPSTRSRMFLRWESYGEPDGSFTLDYYFWVLRHGSEVVVLDTGFAADVGYRRGRTALVDPAHALQLLGIDLTVIATVVLSHLHYDHTGNVHLFSGAHIFAPEIDLRFWTSPVAQRRQFAEHVEPDEIARIVALERDGRLQTFSGEPEILPGIQAIALPGHSPGQYGFLVDTREGKVLLASDAIHFYEELEQDRPFSIVADIGAMYASYERIKSIQTESNATIVPGHDPAVMQRFEPVSSRVAGIAVRLG